MTDHLPDTGKKVALTFTQPHPGFRILLMLGKHPIGAVFPPPNITTLRRPVWVWRFWLAYGVCPEGKSATEQAAKDAILAKARDWLREAGING